MKKENDQYNFIVFPYFVLADGQALEYKNIRIKRSENISDDEIPNQLKEKFSLILKTFKENYKQNGSLKNLKNLSVLTYENKTFFKLGKDEQQIFKKELRELMLFLFISELYRKSEYLCTKEELGYKAWMIRTLENYQAVRYSLNVAGSNFSLRDGYFISINSGGHTFDTIVNVKPTHIVVSDFQKTEIDEDYLKNFLKFKNKDKKKFEQVLLAIELFQKSFTNSILISNNQRILDQVQGFMQLGSFKRDNAKTFREYIATHCDNEDDVGRKKLTYCTYKDKNGKKFHNNSSYKEYWAFTFYKLRNDIIHCNRKMYSGGYTFKSSDINHFFIANLFFSFVVKKIIFESVNAEFIDAIIWNEIKKEFQIEMNPKYLVQPFESLLPHH